MHKSELRQQVADEFKSLVFGPRGGNDEFIEGNRGLTLRYLTGILFPQGEKRADLSSDDESFSEEDGSIEGKTREDFSGDSDNPLSMANEELPSSVGITFVIKKGADFTIHCSAARYKYQAKSEDSPVGYRRIPLEDSVIKANSIKKNQDIFHDGEEYKAKVHIFRRNSKDRKDCEIVTVTLVNELNKNDKSQRSIKNVEKRLYQVNLKCTSSENHIKPYDFNKVELNDMEENILSLQYSDNPIYAIGHGASVDWHEDNGLINQVEISYIPFETVYRPIFDTLKGSDGSTFENSYIFNIANLADNKFDKDKLISGFYELCQFYEQWIDSESNLPQKSFKNAQKHLVNEMKECSQRMRKGIKALENNDNFWEAFRLSNRAMLIQMLQTKKNRDLRSVREKENKPWPIDWNENIDNSLDLDQINSEDSPRWRPFQLAFFLMCFLDFEEEGKENREIADLIWFSTGGGKTEAYLFLACYELIRRRTRYGTPEIGYGTGVLTRYTLRFLTSDQFSRTTSLGCALEKVRLENEDLLGDEQFSIGLFVGSKVSYNRIEDAREGFNQLVDNVTTHLFHVTECPCCGTSIIPSNIEKDVDGFYPGLGIRVTNNAVIYRCQNLKCTFNKINIPVKTVDEEIYKAPPSFLLGTIDKFAEVAWKPEPGGIFGIRPKSKQNTIPPTLIIQDEIHLISGPLGTISAIYEAGFDSLIRKAQRDHNLADTGPKYIASSATVRDSKTQLQRLLGRESKIFPPRGLRIKNSFFANTDANPSNGRLYLGIMPQAFRSTSAAHAVSGAFLQSVRYIAEKDDSKEALDFLWTTLCYCNSLRELGLINSSVNQEILDRMKVCCDAQNQDRDEIQPLNKEEISANITKSISETSDALRTTNNDSSVIDFVPATNMISVGIDIDRLGSMIINGQPKTTSEYIQASSRVGRSPDNIGPGLIIALYSPAKPRDRSHYEQFKAYHQKLYQLVEPTSVTPGSAPALERALHASLVILIRHGVSHMKDNNSAGLFSKGHEEIEPLLSDFKKRLVNIYDENKYNYERSIIEKHIKKVLNNWTDWTKQRLYYNAGKDKSMHSLLINFNQKNDNSSGFRTMHSMRNVDSEVQVRVE
ncbi:helicase-related protein [Pseudothioglobus sp. nBUS_23]|uniref:helicase-related protein n=1 Tax=Pseudothioglobus sp. nBUS_23 TaxID=3395318 RepID=UPI003EBAE9E5